MKVNQNLNKASLPKAVDEAVKKGYSREHAEEILTAYVEQRFITHTDLGDEHEPWLSSEHLSREEDPYGGRGWLDEPSPYPQKQGPEGEEYE